MEGREKSRKKYRIRHFILLYIPSHSLLTVRCPAIRPAIICPAFFFSFPCAFTFPLPSLPSLHHRTDGIACRSGSAYLSKYPSLKVSFPSLILIIHTCFAQGHNCTTQGKGRKSSRLVQTDELAAAKLVDLLSTWSFASTTRQIFRRFRLAILQSHTCILQQDWPAVSIASKRRTDRRTIV